MLSRMSAPAAARRAEAPRDAVALREILTAAYRRLGALQRGEKRCFGVTLPQCLLLELLHQEPRLPVRGLAERLGLDASTVTRLVDVLARDGLVRRARPASGDRRRVLVSLTARGRALAERLLACSDAYCERILARIPGERRGDVLRALAVLADALEELPAECRERASIRTPEEEEENPHDA